jgi:hypothetical protein
VRTKLLAPTAAAVTIATGLSLVPPAAAFATSNPLRQELLNIPQMPTGWASVAGASNDSGPGCLDAALKVMVTGATASANVTFLYGGAFPALAEELEHQPHGMAKVFARVVAVLSACKNLGVSSGSGPTTVGQMSFPRYGDQSEAFAASGGGAFVDTLVMRRGATLMMLAEVDSPVYGGMLSVSQFEHFARLAAAKVH